MGDQLGNVLAPLGQRRQMHRHDVEPVIEILAEAAAGDLLGEVRAVDETTRMSTLTTRWPPTRVKLWSVRTRKILAWAGIGMSAISSRNRVPPWACSSIPGRASSPPSSTPNNSSSTLSGVIRAALTTMNGARARWLQLWSRRAATSLPTPAGPVIRTRLPVLATLFSVARTALIPTLEPVSSVSWPIWARRVAFSRRSRSVSVALATRWRRWLASNGFSMKSTAPWRIAATGGVEIAVARDHQDRQGRVAPS
jgi:hypothetical protein